MAINGMPGSSYNLALAVIVLLGGYSGSDGAATPTAQAKANAPKTGGDARHPVVVELFQSQGCSSCPPANANLNALAGRDDVLALSFAVTYWDKLGWKDIFARPEFTSRQWDYARTGGRQQVATPQVIVNGGAPIVGSNGKQLAALLKARGPLTAGPAIDITNDRVVIGPGKAATPAMVWLVRYEPREIAVPIRAGENGGRTLPHRNIVRMLVPLGEWRGVEADFALPAARPGLKSAVIVQQGPGGPLIAARKL